MSRLDILAHLALFPQDVPDIQAAAGSCRNIYNRHAAVGAADDGLSIEAELSPEESAHVETIRLALAGEGGFFDVGTLLSAVAFLAKHPELVDFVFKKLIGRKG